MEPLEDLTRLPASDVKKRGWRGVMRTLDAEGTLVVTNHEEPEAVIISVQQYADLRAAADRAEAAGEASLDMLRRRFDDRLRSLGAHDAADRLRAVARERPRLRGKVKAGETW